MNNKYRDPPPARISCQDWHSLFREIPDSLLDEYRYYRHWGKTAWNNYLQPPSAFAVYGARYLKRLKYDNSLAALRLWGFLLNESERLFRARQMGSKIVAVMGDLGPLPVLVGSFPNLIPFYPDCLWWTPFLNESEVLFEAAAELGIGEDCCFVRAALGGFVKRAYFPDPDLAIAATGASCDDMAAVIQHARWKTGIPFHHFELPLRRSGGMRLGAEPMVEINGVEAPQAALELLKREVGEVIAKLEVAAGERLNEAKFQESVRQSNRLRSLIAELKRLTYTAPAAPLPALELMNVEFSALTGYGDREETIAILKHLIATVQDRVKKDVGVLDPDAIPIAWVNPTADPLLLCWWEDLGGRVVATEYVIRQALTPLSEGLSPEETIARSILQGSLIGFSGQRAAWAVEEALNHGAEGAIITGIFASSHCGAETWLMRDELSRKLGGPVLTFDVAGPGKADQQAQIRTRMEALAETLKNRRKTPR
ncbi:MAG: 2-hydroxyacyl-CoA dehydratase family protein [Calditrichota bacterium]